MATFDFIASEDFRASLDKDANELIACMKAGAWKAAHILAGSIIQATLIDYLSSSGKAEEDELLKLSFAELVDLSRDQHVLSSRTVDLSGFIRSYLHLIHPSRGIRLQEVADENSARIAQALVEIIVNEIAVHKRKTYGNTAEQIVAKLQSDPSVISILEHILRRTSHHELERLLLDAIPDAYFHQAQLLKPEAYHSLKNLEQCYRLAFDLAPEDLKRKATRKFLAVLQEESEYTVQCYESCFFRGSDLRFLEEAERQTVKAHFFASLNKNMTIALVNSASGIGSFLVTEQDARGFFVPLVLRMLEEKEEDSRTAILRRINEEYGRISAQNQWHIQNWIERCKDSLRQAGRDSDVAILERLETAL